jgi:phosphoribosylanthranilate isomerase
MAIRIKICGVTIPSQLEAFDEMGVDLGVYFLSKVAQVHGR